MDGILTGSSAKPDPQHLPRPLKKEEDDELTAARLVAEDWEVIKWLLDHGANPNAACRLDLTPMSFAVQNASLQTISLLFGRAGDIKSGQLIHHAIERDENVIEVLNQLLQKGARVNAVMNENHQPSWNLQYFKGIGTALHRAAELGKADVAGYLVQNGAAHSLQDSKRRTALDYARRYNHPEIIELLQSS
ncbi:uncharacterized protein BP5553_05979 [Venustampulla echinocandica]|uniref:Uncharacterized protein n=1 Tax=Venustampulla echinocandica TaxID=2656787 RepID=A0A370TM71_9HELO|nr:uncharacterized protein BP5553_05979 [Venustampulla echinocandica]RDL36627.1 hypothetical protein BP5553_05979 [Venustampulla echinocandica]